jgi:hypothetical protein
MVYQLQKLGQVKIQIEIKFKSNLNNDMASLKLRLDWRQMKTMGHLRFRFFMKSKTAYYKLSWKFGRFQFLSKPELDMKLNQFVTGFTCTY